MSSMPHSLSQSQMPLPPASSQSQVMDQQAPLQSTLLSQPYPYGHYGSYPGPLPNTSSSAGTPSAHSTAPSTATPPPASSGAAGFVSPSAPGPAMHSMSSAPTASPSNPAYAYAPYVPPPAHDPGIYSQPQWAGSVEPHPPLYAAPHQNTFVPPPPQSRVPPNVYSFVPIQGPQQHKRPRRRYEEIERIYRCGWNGCEKAYGTLNHLNAHVTMQTHGQKRTSDEFKDIRAAWKQRNKENDARKREEIAQAQSAAASAASMPTTPLYFAHPQHVAYQHSPVGYPVMSPMNGNPNGSFPVSPYGAPQPGAMATGASPIQPSQSSRSQQQQQQPPQPQQQYATRQEV